MSDGSEMPFSSLRIFTVVPSLAAIDDRVSPERTRYVLVAAGVALGFGVRVGFGLAVAPGVGGGIGVGFGASEGSGEGDDLTVGVRV